MLYLMTMSVKRLLFTFILLILLGLLAVPAAAWAGEAVQVVQTVTPTWTATGTLTPDDPVSTPEVTTTPMIAKRTPERAQAILSTIPLGREVKPEEIAAAALYLASKESAMITVENLVVDGGRTLIS